MTEKEDRFGKAPFRDDDIYEMHKIRLKFFMDRKYTSSQVLAFLSSEFVGTLALHGCSEDFVKKTFDRMFEKFKEHPLRKN